MICKLRWDRLGHGSSHHKHGHCQVTLFTGPDPEHLANAGELTFPFDKAVAFRNAIRMGEGGFTGILEEGWFTAGVKHAKTELLDHIGEREVKYVRLIKKDGRSGHNQLIAGSLDEVLPRLDYYYPDGYSDVTLFGRVFYADGTVSERCYYDGRQEWEHYLSGFADADTQTGASI